MANRVTGPKTRKPKSQQEEHHEANELLENPDALRERISGTEDFVKKNAGLLGGLALAVALIIGGFFGYRYYLDRQNDTAQEEMFQAVFYFEADSLNLALDGDGNNYGFLEIIDEFGGTDAANLAHYYSGVIYLKQGNYEEAIDHLSDFSASDLLVQAKAYSLVGDAYMELEQYGEAAEQYERAADYKPNEYFSPQYLKKAALAHQAGGNLAAAAAAYERIVDEFPQSNEFQEAQKQHIRLQALSSGS
jgi:tetratricopeptide (TPR) repeat protein